MERLLDYCSISGKSVKKYKNEKNYIATGDVIENEIVSSTQYTFEDKPSRANLEVIENEVLFAKMKNTIKILLIDKIKEKNIYSTGFYVLKANEKLNPKYLYWFLNSEYFNEQKDKYSVGATIKALNNEGLGKIIINEIPEISEQNVRVDVLENINEAIKNRILAIHNYEELISSKINIYIKKYTEKVDLLGKYINTQGGYAFKSEKFSESGIPVIRIGNVNLGYFTSKDLKFYEETNELKKYLLYPGDLVMTLTGTVGKEDYGNVCILGNEYEKYYLNQRILKIECKNINKTYLKYLLQIKKYKNEIIRKNRGVRQANISNRDIEELEIPILPDNIQKQFEQEVKLIYEAKEHVEKDIELLKELLKAKLHEYFS